jgi:uncharacterized protein (TIGR03437 family)
MPRALLHAQMLRLLLLIAGFSVSACAQFFGLATPADGSRVYFATPLRQKDTTQTTYGKLFQVDDSGLKLVLARDKVSPGPAYPGAGYLTNAYDLVAADVSSDGQVVAAAARLDCTDGYGIAPCLHIPQVHTTITRGGQSHDYEGMLRLSANGKWAIGIVKQSFIPYANLVNVATGEVTQTCGYCSSIAISGRPIANDGTAVFSNNEPWINVQRGTGLLRIPIPGQSSDAVVDAAATTIVFSVPGELRITSPDATSTALLTPDGYAPSVTDDGQQVLYLSKRTGVPQVYLINTDGSGDRALTNEADGIDHAILSGDGTIAYAVTLGGRLLKISVASTGVRELIPRTPIFFGSLPRLSPGKLVTLSGFGFSSGAYSAAPPLPDSLGGVRVSIQGIPARIQSVIPTAITLLVPPDVGIFADSTSVISLEVSLSSPFELLDAHTLISQFAPEVIYFAAHDDWSGQVSTQNPARPGEVLHAYAVGLGPTMPSVPYGEAAPAQEPLARISLPISCTNTNYRSNGQSVEVLFAGLAPGMVGIYQVDWRVPSAVADPYLTLACQFGGGPAYTLGFVLVSASGAP